MFYGSVQDWLSVIRGRLRGWIPAQESAVDQCLDMQMLEDRILYSATPMPIDAAVAVEVGMEELDHALTASLLDSNCDTLLP